MTSVGTAAWSRRKSWRSFSWQQLMTVGLLLGGFAYALCMPAPYDYWRAINYAVYRALGICHVHDLIGHLVSLAASSCVIAAVAYRLVAADRIEDFMVRIEVPAALAAFAMVICMLCSRSTKHWGTRYFVDLRLDGWLTAYWLIYSLTDLYLLAYLVRLLVILRGQDKRSRRSADLFIAAVCVASAAIVGRVVAVLAPSVQIPNSATWALYSISVVLTSLGAAVSWRRGAQICGRAAQPSLLRTRLVCPREVVKRQHQ
jgi:hypothetical protein